MLNLEHQAWELFKTNSQQFKMDDRLPSEFCEKAVREGVLTRRPGGGEEFLYRFVHERVHRFFVAGYLGPQDDFSLSEWHEKLEPGFERVYWADVIEFLGAIRALSTQGPEE